MSEFDFLVDRQSSDSKKWAKYREREVIPMWVADMDFRSPQPVLEAIRRRVNHGVFGYTEIPAGLIEIVVARLEARYSWMVEESDILFSPGLVPALNQVCRGLVRAGGSVITAVPVYRPFLDAPENMNRGLIALEMCEEDNWRFPVAELARQVAARPEIDLLLLCNPLNPLGRMLSVSEMQEIVAICDRYDVKICSDEIHCELVLDGRQHTPIASLSRRAADITITLMAASKTFNLAGLGCAVVIAENELLREQFRKAGEGIMANVNTFGYVATEAAWTDCADWHEALLVYLAANRDYVYDRCQEITGIRVNRVEATYLAWLNVQELGLEDPLSHFEKAGVGLSSGDEFRGSGYMRLNFGCPRPLLEEGLNRIERVCNR
jgi:cysteine-S-conjugate beta-lyase